MFRVLVYASLLSTRRMSDISACRLFDLSFWNAFAFMNCDSMLDSTASFSFVARLQTISRQARDSFIDIGVPPVFQLDFSNWILFSE